MLDCSKICANGGALVNCSVCECTGNSTYGKVTITGTNLPLADVDVYVIGHEWESLASTNRMGEFVLENVCLADLELRFTKAGYLSDEEKYSASPSPLAVTMTEMSTYLSSDYSTLHC